MAIGVQNDYTFYKGYEGEPEIIFQTDEHTLHIWDGYMGDIWGNPTEKDEEWCGFTRDYNEFTGAFADDCIEYLLDIEEYLKDAKKYIGQKFGFEESAQVLNTIILFLEAAQKNTLDVTVSLK